MTRLSKFTSGLATALVVSLHLTNASEAETTDGVFAVRGIGAQTCVQLNDAFVDGQRGRVKAALAAWSAGWLSHANRTSDNTFDLHPFVSNGDIAELVARLCRSNPDAIIETVLASSTASLEAGASSVPSDLVEIEADERTIILRKAVLKKLQDALAAEGMLEPKMADGLYGPSTAGALRQFQADRGITVSGLPDMVTLYMVFVGE